MNKMLKCYYCGTDTKYGCFICWKPICEKHKADTELEIDKKKGNIFICKEHMEEREK